MGKRQSETIASAEIKANAGKAGRAVVATATTTTPIVAGRMASGQRREQIVRVAMRLFSERGFRGTTTREIAAAAGVNEAIIFRHFATKEELYTAILDNKACAGNMNEMCHEVEAATGRGDDRAVFQMLARHMLEHNEQDQEFMRLLLHAALEGHELSRMFWDRNVRKMSDCLRAYVSERQKAGALRTTLDPLLMTRAFVGMINFHSLINNLFDPQRTFVDVSNERAARDFTEILMNGISAGETLATKPQRKNRNAKPKQTRPRKVSTNKVATEKPTTGKA